MVAPAAAAPDEVLLGKRLGYRIGRPDNWFYDEKVRVGSFNHLDQIMPSNVLQKSSTPLALSAATSVPKIAYWFDNQSHTIDDFLARFVADQGWSNPA
jgi:hypothetical protein